MANNYHVSDDHRYSDLAEALVKELYRILTPMGWNKINTYHSPVNHLELTFDACWDGMTFRTIYHLRDHRLMDACMDKGLLAFLPMEIVQHVILQGANFLKQNATPRRPQEPSHPLSQQYPYMIEPDEILSRMGVQLSKEELLARYGRSQL